MLTESPRNTSPAPATGPLELRYPTGSRVVLAIKLPDSTKVQGLSEGLCAAGDPIVSGDGRRVIFAGKRTPEDDWQIFETRPAGGVPRPLTAVAGGAVNPALLGDGSLIYVSPARRAGQTNRSALHRAALFVQPPGGLPHQISFSSADISNPTVLDDGRILFVSSQPSAANHAGVAQALYTVNNDGTEVTAFAGQHDSATSIQRPRQLDNGRIVFLAGSPGGKQPEAQFVTSARPFTSRALLLSNVAAVVHSVQPGLNGELFVCAALGAGSTGCEGHSSVFRLCPTATSFGSPFITDTNWNVTECVPVTPSRRPMGRISNVDSTRTTGQILCLNVNNSSFRLEMKDGVPQANRIRVFAEREGGRIDPLGEIRIQPDGSFMAEVPADTPLGFETIDEGGRVLRHGEPLIWLRPGENRACIGCHEPHNHSPRNFRPLAVRQPVPKVLGQMPRLASTGSNR